MHQQVGKREFATAHLSFRGILLLISADCCSISSQALAKPNLTTPKQTGSR